MFFLLSFALLGICVYGSLKLNRRAFYRRNRMGVEEFQDYGHMLKTKFKEGAIGVALGICGLAGIVSLFVGGIILTK